MTDAANRTMDEQVQAKLNDVAFRLRAELDRYKEQRFPGPFEIRPSLVREAVDEIERLREVMREEAERIAFLVDINGDNARWEKCKPAVLDTTIRLRQAVRGGP